ncbi:MAG TPA: SRPBCC family protein [Streptosporangiaceae bacterium]|jgi:carbon monoxide dehydrogenase subunit G
MELEHEFTIPVPVDRAWPVLLDVERVAPCMPGASLDSVDGDAFTGRLKVKVGPITVTYKGDARITKKDADEHAVTMEASGKEARGTGTAAATVDAQLHAEGDNTRVTVRTNFNVTGKPAQFGRGVMSDVGGKLIDKFAERLEAQLSGGDDPAADSGNGQAAVPAGGSASATTTESVPPPREGGAEQPSGASAPRPTPMRPVVAPDDDAIDLLDVAGMPMLKRLVPVAVGVLVLGLLFRVLRRRRRNRK